MPAAGPPAALAGPVELLPGFSYPALRPLLIAVGRAAALAPLHRQCDVTSQAQPRFERRLRVRFGHCDPAGIVFYPQYFVLFNELIEDWVTEGLGISYAGLVGQRRIGMPTVSLTIDFRAISRMGDEVALGLQVERLGSRSLTLALDCRAGAEERVRARKVIVTTSLDTHHAVAIPGDLRAAIDRFSSSPSSSP